MRRHTWRMSNVFVPRAVDTHTEQTIKGKEKQRQQLWQKQVEPQTDRQAHTQ